MDELKIDRFDLEELKKWFNDEKEDMPAPMRMVWEKIILPSYEHIVELKEKKEFEDIENSPPPTAVPVFEESEYRVMVKLGKRWVELKEDKNLGVWVLPVRIEEIGLKVLTGNIFITKKYDVVFLEKEVQYGREKITKNK